MNTQRWLLKMGMVVGMLLMFAPIVAQWGAAIELMRSAQAQGAAGGGDLKAFQDKFYQATGSMWISLSIGLLGGAIFTVSLMRSRRLSAAMPPPLPSRQA